MLVIITIAAAVFLAFANGANDNAKGVATLVGGGTLPFPRALRFAAVTTFLGSVTAVVFSHKLIALFSGKGLVADQVTQTTAFLASVGAAAAFTVLLATRLAMPISTTHAMVGGITGVGLSAHALNGSAVLSTFFLPLLASPLMALACTAGLYVALRWARLRLGVNRETCVCVEEQYYPATCTGDPAMLSATTSLGVVARPRSQCCERYSGRLVGFDAQRLLDGSHIVSGGLISFARGLNDTPKIAALLVSAKALSPSGATTSVGVAMAVGGVFAVHRVAKVLSYKIVEMNDGQAFTGNVVTALGVIVASRMGLPVSTTHVSCGSLFGIGLVNGRSRGAMVGKILTAWAVTLPISAIAGWCLWRLLAT